MNVVIGPPDAGFGEIREPYETIIRSSGDFSLGVYTQPRVTENLPYEIDVQIIPPPPPTPLPNNWACTVYPSSAVPRFIDDLVSVGSTVSVPANGTVTHVGIKNLTFRHTWMNDLAFGLQAPDNTLVSLFSFEATGQWYGSGCDDQDCSLTLDDAGIEGLTPP